MRADLYLASKCIYPPADDKKYQLTRLQERLIRKLGKNAYPFFFQVNDFTHFFSALIKVSTKLSRRPDQFAGDRLVVACY